MPSAYAETLKQKLDVLMDKSLPYASVGVSVKDLQSGKDIYKRNDTKLLSPASGIKLFTAAASLYKLGPNYQYETSILKHDSSIYVRFSGDPSLKTNELQGLIKQLKDQGISRIEGNIVLDSSKYQPPNYAAGINYDDLGWYYVAPSSAIVLNENKETFEFISATKLGQPVKIKSQHANPPVKLINQLISVSKEQKENHCNFNIDIKPNNTLKLYGCLSQYKDTRRLSLAITNPAIYAQEVVKQALTAQQINLKGKIIVGTTPSSAKLIAQHQSKPLISLVKHMLMESDNLYADSLTKLLGFSLTRQGTYKQGAYAIKQIISKHTNLNVDNLDISDGQGTRYNLISPSQMVVLLNTLYTDKSMWKLISTALPVMGESGSLAWRMKESALKSRVIGKTGTMHDISSLSGYLTTQNGKQLAFSIIINGMHKDIGKAKRLEENMLNVLYQHAP
jgi:serine-type D-Ala-D-Ala carboxypeptidase/endopeptidase (penicillin-binding protein 4)